MNYGKVIYLVDLHRLMGGYGWRYEPRGDRGGVYRKHDGAVLAVHRHPQWPHLVYLADLVNQVAGELRAKLTALAVDEHRRFDVFIERGRADSTTVDEFLAALSGLNEALGGTGLRYEVLHETRGAGT